ncbi:hypothetical protein O0L34_g2961 [Tuta absoluta]|nr:hypothetical protein O0L34_g2961 [Tuta absoluta]
MGEVSQAAGPLWTRAGPEERARFEALAKEEKARVSAPENRLTCTGESIAELQAAERELQKAAETERNAIKKFVAHAILNDRLLDEDIFVMDVNCYCKAHGIYNVGEVTLLRFTLRDGVQDKYHKLVNPGIPYAYTSDVKYWSKQFALPMIDESDHRSDFIQIFTDIMNFLKMTHATPSRKELPPIYTLPDKVPQCSNFLMQLSHKATHNETLFNVYLLHTLYYQIVHQISPKYQKDEYFTKEAVALTQLERDSTFKYCSGLACQMHDEADRALVCTSVRALSWTYTVLETTCALLGVRAQPARHQPEHYEPDEEEPCVEPSYRRVYDDQPAATANPSPPNDKSLAAASVEKKCYEQPKTNVASIAGEARYVPPRKPIDPIPTASSVTSSAAAAVKERRHVPLRMPKTHIAVASTKSSKPAAAERHPVTPKTDFNMTSNTPTAVAAGEKRRHVPLRMPKQDYSMSVRAALAFTADRRDFPSLPTRGRGRGLAEYVNRMRL